MYNKDGMSKEDRKRLTESGFIGDNSAKDYVLNKDRRYKLIWSYCGKEEEICNDKPWIYCSRLKESKGVLPQYVNIKYFEIVRTK